MNPNRPSFAEATACQAKLSDADKFDLQQYITRCSGSLAMFNVQFKNKDDQFRTGAQGSAVGRPNALMSWSERIEMRGTR